MSRILRFFVCLGTLFFAGNALAAGYSCSSLPKYLSCQHGYYMTSSQSSTTHNGTPRVGNYCQPCSRMGSNYTCAGGTAAPVQSAGGYTCPTYMKYTSCSVGYYMTSNSTSTAPDGTPKVRNACRPCSVYGANYTCAGGTAAPQAIKINVTCPKGQYLPQGATSCTTCPAGSFCPGQTCNDVSLVTGATSACGITSCRTATSYYFESAAGSSNINDCYRTLSVAEKVETVNNGPDYCTSGEYCDNDGRKVYYDEYNEERDLTDSRPTIARGTACARGSYSDDEATACEPCPNGTTTSGTGSGNCGVTCSNSANVKTWVTPTWTPNYVSNLCKIDSCVACTKGTGVASCSASIVNNTCTYTATCASGYKNPTCNGSSCSCEISTYTVTLNATANGGTGGTSVVYQMPGTGWYSNAAATNAISSITMPTKTNSVFNGYYSARSGGTRYITNAGALPSNTPFSSNTTLYAQYSAASCNVTNGSATMSISGNKVSCAVTCNTGYSQSGGTNATTSFTVTGAVGTASVSASCSPRTFTVSLMDYDGTSTHGTIYEKYATGWYSDAAATKAITSITMPTKTNSVFNGYYSAQSGGTRYITDDGALPSSNTTFTANTTLYAQYSAAGCNVTHGSATMSISGNAVSCYVTCDTGYSMNGGTDTTTIFTEGGSVGQAWVTSKCFARTSTVSFNANGGTGGQSANATAKYDSAMPSISTTAPTRTGYTFMGWYDNATYTSGTQYYTAAGASARTWNKVADTTLYAGWKVNSYTCSAGQYLKAGATACATCTANSWCGGGTFSFNSETDQGLNACPSDYSYSDAGTSSENNCYKNATNTGSQIAPALPTGCAAQTVIACHPDKCWYRIYKSGTTTSCTPTNCNQTHKACTSASKNYYLASGVAKSCSSADASYPSSDGGDIAASSCYGTFSKTGSQVNGSVPTGCASVTSWNACTPGTCQYTKYASGTVKTDCTPTNCTKTVKSVTASAKYYANGASCSACPSGYPNSDAGNSGGITACYSNSKSRAWTGSQVNGSTPTNCNSVTSWNACSLPACSYVAYSNSTGNGDGTIKSGCSTNNASCTKTVAAVTAKSGYYVSGTSCMLCRELASGMYPNSDNGNTGGASACRTNSLSGQVIATANASSATQCVAGTYKAAHTVNYGSTSDCGVCSNNQYSNAGAASCTGCKTANGYTNSGTAAASHAGEASCKATCAAGTYVATAGSACTTVGTGYWGAGGTVSQNTTLGRNQCPEKYRDGAAATQKSDCAVQTTAGKYIAAPEATEQTPCPAKNYCPSASVKYGETNSPKACPTADATTARTTYPDDYLNPTRLSISNQGWSTGLPAITSCSANYTFTNAAGNFTVESVEFNETSGKYEVGGGKYYTFVNAGWYLVDKYSETYCDEPTNRMLYHNVAECTANSYCPGYNSMPLCSTGTHNDEMGRFACSDLGNGYNYSPAKSGATTACYLTTTPGKYVAAPKAAESTCIDGGWCPGGVRVNYGSTGGRTLCSSLSGVSVTGGTYTSAAGSSANTACKYTAPNKTITGCKTVTTNTVTYSGTAWPATTYGVTANGGYIISGNNTAAATCSQCSGAVWSAGGTATSCSACPAQTSGWIRNSGTGWTAVTQCNQTKSVGGNCSAGVLKQNATSTTAWGSSTISTPLQANPGSVVKGQQCERCDGAVWSAGGTATSCSACPAQTSGWIRNSGTGWTAVTQCNQTKSVGGNCSAGVLKQNATSTTAWGSSTISTPLKANPGSIVNGQQCDQCDAGTYSAGGTATSCSACTGRTKYSAANASACSTVSTGYYTTGCNSSNNNCTGQSQCTSGTWCASGVQKQCSSLSGVSVTGGTYTSAAGSSANTACKYTAPNKTITGCKTVTTNTVTYSGTAWPATTYGVTANGGYIISGNNTAAATCSQCGTAKYSAGGTATSCSSCPNADSGWTAMSPAGSTAYTACYEYQTPANCASGSVKRAASSATAYSSTISLLSTLKSKAGYYASTTATSCTICPAGSSCAASATAPTTCANWTYAASTGMSSCTACPALTSGWTKADSTGTGWKSHTNCVQISPKPANCAGGNLKQVAASNGATTWGASTVNSALSSEPGYYIDGTACSACTGATYYGGGTATSCTPCPSIYTSNTTAAKSKAEQCAVQTTAGKYIATANDSTQTTCPAKNYCPSASVAYGSVNSPTACPAANSTTERTTYPTDYLNVTERGYFVLQSWPSGLKAITDCMTSYSFVNEAGRFIVENVGYNTTTGKYDVDGIRYYTMLNPGWYLKDRLSSEYCNTTSNPMYYSNVVQCPEDHYCPGYTTMPLCSSGEYTTEKGKNACSSLGTGVYTKSPVKSGAETACYLTTSNSKFVAAAGAAEGACTAGGWCPGGVRVNYGSTGGRNTCPTKYPSSAASSNSELDCYVTTAAGKYVATVGAGQVNCAGTGYYCPGGTNVYSGAYGSRLTTGGRTQCPAGYRDLVATASTTKEAQCTMNVAGGKYVKVAKESAASGTCAAGYAKAAHSVTYGNTSSCAACTGTTYAENTGQASCTACPTQSGVTNISYWISTGTHTDANGCYGFYNDVALNNGSAARIQCFWDKTKSQYDTSCGAMKDGLKCNAAYYNAALESSPINNAAYYTDKASVIAKACTSVGKGYWSPADVYTRTQCPAGYRDGTAGVSEAQCTMNVAGGKYVAKANESAASGTCVAGYAKAAHSVTYGNTSSCAACTGATYAASTGQATCTACPTAKTYASAVKSYGYWNNGKDGDHTISDGCYATMTGTLSNGSLTEHGCYLGTDGDYGNGGGKRCYVHQDNLKCNAGYYASTLSNGYVWNNTRAGLLGNTCVGVGAGYYSAANILTRNQCPTGLTTIGYGAGADEVTDCGRILHFGNDKLYLRSGKKTTPSLNVKIGDTTYYGNMTAGTGKGKLRLKSGPTTYSVHDDSM